MKEFLGIGGYARVPEGYMSWQHLVFVTSLIAVMIALAVLIGKRFGKKNAESKNRVLMAAAVLMDGVEIFKLRFFAAVPKAFRNV